MSNKYILLITAAFFSLSVFIYVLVIALLNHATWAVDVSGPIGAAVLTFIGHWIKKLTTHCVPADAGVTVEATPVETVPTVETPVAVVESAVVAAAPSIFKKLSNIFQPKAPAPVPQVVISPADLPWKVYTPKVSSTQTDTTSASSSGTVTITSAEVPPTSPTV